MGLIPIFDNIMLPGYLCQCNDYIGQIENDSSKAISLAYAQFFKNETRFSGLLVLGWQDDNITQQLSNDVLFTPMEILINSLKIFVYEIGVSSNENWHNAGSGYKSSLIHKYNDRQAIYVSQIDDDKCILEIYQDNQIKKRFEGESPNDVWNNSGQIKKYNGNQLFGPENFLIQNSIQQHKVPTCISKEWNNIIIMEQLYKYHLKRYTTSEPIKS
ncbi:hypothetical protein Glove_69g34 [Diversispora epigaea]|uniref:Uncharacterized protein n=1 Tax=Diversispora epigaea TaxID=1348612 RepID=A0A397JEI6_9GLOM|nr:hypothetical protein Glove_69g34 [Diversispora epigaea]